MFPTIFEVRQERERFDLRSPIIRSRFWKNRWRHRQRVVRRQRTIGMDFRARRLRHHRPALFGTAADTTNQMPANQFSPCLLQNVSRKSFVTSIALIHLAFL